MVPGQWDRRSKLAAVGHRSRTARQSSTWERGKIGRRRRIHTEMTKTITIIDTRIRIHTSTSRRVKVKSTFGGPPPIDKVCVDPVPVYMVALRRHSADLLTVWGPLAWLKHSVATSSRQLSNDPRPLRVQTTALVDGEASARRSKKTFGPHVRVHAYGKDSTKRRQLWGSFRRFGEFLVQKELFTRGMLTSSYNLSG